MPASHLISHLLFGGIIFLISVVLTKAVLRLNIVDEPNIRSSHDIPTPRSGGLAVTFSFLAGMVFIYIFAQWSRIADVKFIAFIVACLLIAAISFIDDKKGLGFKIKFLWQIIASLILVFSGLTFGQADIPFIFSPFLLSVLTVMWLLFFMNAFNFMDGLNGLAGGTTIIACIFLMVIGFYQNAAFIYVCALILGCATLGFFIFNFPRAQIFLGDTGSQFIALILASLGIIGTGHDHGTLSTFTVPLLFYVFIFDVILTIIRRAHKRRNIFSAHRSHVYQLLNRAGLSHVAVSCIQFLHIIIGGLAACWVNFGGGNPLVATLFVFFVFVVYTILTYFYARHRVTPSNV